MGALERTDAIELVSEVMKRTGWTPPVGDSGSTPHEITELVDAVNRHARALVLLTREVARRGVKATTENLRELMAELERKHAAHDDRFKIIFTAIRELMEQPKKARRKIGF